MAFGALLPTFVVSPEPHAGAAEPDAFWPVSELGFEESIVAVVHNQ
tara:strand:- start:1367 stop:1504 length:138 start_codon:yes stop_codon:yes gene_type:complete